MNYTTLALSNSDQLVEDIDKLLKQSLMALVMLVVVVIVYLLAMRIVSMAHKHEHLPEKMMRTIRKVLRWSGLVVAALLVLQAYGLLGSAVTAIASMFALVAIGFVAVWSVLSNTLCSMILMITRPFRVGDMVRFPGDDIQGKVVNFNMVFTTLKTEDEAMIQVPNNLFFQRLIVRIPTKKKPIELGDQLYEQKDAKV